MFVSGVCPFDFHFALLPCSSFLLLACFVCGRATCVNALSVSKDLLVSQIAYFHTQARLSAFPLTVMQHAVHYKYLDGALKMVKKKVELKMMGHFSLNHCHLGYEAEGEGGAPIEFSDLR